MNKKISLLIAILININIVVGGGFFLSARNMFTSFGALAPLSWVICGLLLLPLVYVLARLSNAYPTAGGLYVYSQKTLGNWFGFISGWGYYIGTVAGNAVILHGFSMQLQKLGLFNQMHVGLDIACATLFTLLTLFNVTVLEKMHIGFTILKTIPFAVVLGGVFTLFNWSNVIAAPIQPTGLVTSMPIVLFAYVGIEACTAITHAIKDGHKNSARAMLISLGIIIALYSLIQFSLLGILGTHTTNPFTEIIPKLTSNPFVITWGNTIVNLAILSSFLGGFYGMFYANNWNLFAIATEKRVVGHSLLTKLNKHHAPWVAVLVQGALVIAFLLITANTEYLMTMSDFGVVIAYILSVFAYFVHIKKQGLNKKIIATFALVACLTLLFVCINNLALSGARYIIPFIIMLISGLLLHKN